MLVKLTFLHITVTTTAEKASAGNHCSLQGLYRNLTVVFQDKIISFSTLFKAFCSSLCE